MGYDNDGLWGKNSGVSKEIVYILMEKHLFFTHPPSKTTGRELFGNDQAIELIKICTDAGLSPGDTMATITRITLTLDTYRTWGSKDKDGKLDIEEDYVQKELGSDARMTMLDMSGVGGEAKEAITFAFQAIDAVLGRLLVVPQKVETKKPTIVEKVSPGRNNQDLMTKSVAFGANFEGEYLPPVNEMVLE